MQRWQLGRRAGRRWPRRRCWSRSPTTTHQGGSYLASVVQAYRIQVSSDSTNGSDGAWTTAVTVTGNPAYAREHLIAFTGRSWVKLMVDTCTGGQLDELNVWDATNGTPDTFAFLGDSITDGALRRHFYFGGGLLPSFQENVLENQPGHYPLQLNVGVTGQGAAYWAANIASALALYPDVRYWCVGVGMNDGASMPGQLTQWRTDMTTVLNAITAAGRVPILARTTWTGAAGYGGGDYATCGLRYLNDNGVDYLVSTLGVRPGPDLFALFNANGAAYAVTSDPHPNQTGYKAWTNAWADSLGTSELLYGTSTATLAGATSSASGTFTLPTASGSSSLTLAGATSSTNGTVTLPTVSGASSNTLAGATSAASGSTAAGASTATLTGVASVAAGVVGARWRQRHHPGGRDLCCPRAVRHRCLRRQRTGPGRRDLGRRGRAWRRRRQLRHAVRCDLGGVWHVDGWLGVWRFNSDARRRHVCRQRHLHAGTRHRGQRRQPLGRRISRGRRLRGRDDYLRRRVRHSRQRRAVWRCPLKGWLDDRRLFHQARRHVADAGGDVDAC
jgi:lysophospholipase L1-like esterase